MSFGGVVIVAGLLMLASVWEEDARLIVGFLLVALGVCIKVVS